MPEPAKELYTASTKRATLQGSNEFRFEGKACGTWAFTGDGLLISQFRAGGDGVLLTDCDDLEPAHSEFVVRCELLPDCGLMRPSMAGFKCRVCSRETTLRPSFFMEAPVPTCALHGLRTLQATWSIFLWHRCWICCVGSTRQSCPEVDIEAVITPHFAHGEVLDIPSGDDADIVVQHVPDDADIVVQHEPDDADLVVQHEPDDADMVVQRPDDAVVQHEPDDVDMVVQRPDDADMVVQHEPDVAVVQHAPADAVVQHEADVPAGQHEPDDAVEVDFSEEYEMLLDAFDMTDTTPLQDLENMLPEFFD